MFWRRKKTSDYIDDSRFAPASEAAPTTVPRNSTPPAALGTPTLTVEDVFTITGRGLVATGVVAGGALRVGQPVTVHRDGLPVAGSTITGVEAFRKLLDSAEPGQNVGLLLRDLRKDQVQRGDQIVATA